MTVLSVKTAVASRADALGLRSLRFAINSVVPVIGSAISEGLLSIQSYAGLVKSTVGVVGIIGVIALFLPALINVIGWRVSIAVSVAVSEIYDDRTVCKMLRAFGDAFLLMNVVLILSMVTTVISSNQVLIVMSDSSPLRRARILSHRSDSDFKGSSPFLRCVFCVRAEMHP